ncbi:MAG: EamA family transporter [Bdellovibrionales bacterium]|nr:EamA family transporter [Bdellovibrionales bacterium]
MIVIITTLLATFFIQLGYFSWKITADSLPKFELKNFISHYVINWKWLLGFFATFIGWLLFIHATSIGAISIVQPLMSVGDVFLIFLAFVFLKEKVSKIEAQGLLLIILGAASLSLEARVESVKYLHWNYTNFLCVLFVLVWVVLFKLRERYEKKEIIYAFLIGISFGLGAALSKLMTTHLTLSGLGLGPMSVIINPIFPFMVLTNIVGIILLQLAFQVGRASIIVPIQLSVVNIVAVIFGVIVFDEKLLVSQILGIALISIGTLLLHIKKRS